MAERESKRPGVTGFILGGVGLAGAAVVFVGTFNHESSYDSWQFAAGVAAILAVFLTLSLIKRPLWGVAGALLFAWSGADYVKGVTTAEEWTAEVLILALLPFAVLAHAGAQRPKFARIRWSLLLVGVSTIVSLAWNVQELRGRSTLLIPVAASGEFLFAGLSAARARRRLSHGDNRPARSNIAAALAIAFLAPIVGVAVTVLLGESLTANDFRLTLDPANVERFVNSIDPQTVWPYPALLLPLIALGLWRAFRRSRILARNNQPPSPRVLLDFTALVSVYWLAGGSPAGCLIPVPMVLLAVALSVFGVADQLSAFAEWIVLRPPEGDTGVKLVAGPDRPRADVKK
jgi:hypothetical protein